MHGDLLKRSLLIEPSEKCNKYLNFVTLNLFQGLFKGILKQVQNDVKANIIIFQKFLDYRWLLCGYFYTTCKY